MNKLISANFNRLKKDKVFWSLIITFILFSFIICFKQSDNKNMPIDNVLFWGEMGIGIAIALFTCLFVGREYSDGTIRNKLIVGHSRINIYLSNLITSIFAGIIFNLSYVISALLIGMCLFEPTNLSTTTIIYLIVDILFMIISFASLFTLIAMLISSKTNGSITSILLVFGLMIVSSGMFNSLIQPKYIDSYYNKDGKMEVVTSENPKYISGQKRKNLEFILDTLPTGQSIQIVILSTRGMKTMYLKSLGVILILNAFGLASFVKKDLK